VTVLLVAIGAAIGAPLRYLIDRAIQGRHESTFPWGTLTVNVVGSMLLGFLVGLPADHALTALLGTGFCGTLTTYSTFSFETMKLARSGERLLAGANAIGSVLAGLGAAYVGLLIAQAIH
jgi:CrcB protein